MRRTQHPVIALLSSFGLSVACLLYLLVLTYFGTLYQVDHGLKQAQERFFDSWFLAGPLPGGQLVMVVLFVNLVVGGIVRLRIDRRRIGVLITHLGMVLMLLAGWVKYYQSDDGYLRLYEGEESDRFVSHYRWEIAITEGAAPGYVREHIVAHERFAERRPESVTTIRTAGLPFELVLSGFVPNATVTAATPSTPTSSIVRGRYLQQMPREVEAEHDTAGVYATVKEHDADPHAPPERAILWGAQRHDPSIEPWVVTVRGKRYAIELRHETYPMPFSLRLDKFIKEDHPGTTMAARYASEVTKSETESTPQPVVIQMNEPLRQDGYVVFQSGFGPPDARPGEPLYSIFSVVRNPSDQWPLISCVIIGFGMAVHFLTKLFLFLGSQSRMRARGSVG